MELLIRGARIVDSFQDFIGDVYVRNGKIFEIGKEIDKNCYAIEGDGLTLLPSFTDLHSHFRDPGLTHKEDILSGSRAAVRGGYTTVNLMANTKPAASNMEIFKYAVEKGNSLGLVDIHQTLTITKNLEGKDISHLEDLTDEVKFISDDGRGIVSNRIMHDAMIKARDKGITLISHVEDEEISSFETRLSENLMTIRDIMLAEHTGCHLHFAHVSTSDAMEYIIDAKNRGVNVTCEVSPHHIGLTEKVKYRVNPPLRREDDVKFLIDAIKDGWVDAIATDHAPHTAQDKENGAPGISGLETSFPVCYTKLVKNGHISLNKLSEIMSKNPSKIMGVNKGEIKIGYEGDFVLVDLEKSFVVKPGEFESRGKNTPFEGMELFGETLMTIKGGKIVYEKGEAR